MLNQQERTAPSRPARAVLARLDSRVLRTIVRAGWTLVVDPAERALAAATRGVHSARMALDLLDVMAELQRLAARS